MKSEFSKQYSQSATKKFQSLITKLLYSPKPDRPESYIRDVNREIKKLIREGADINERVFDRINCGGALKLLLSEGREYMESTVELLLDEGAELTGFEFGKAIALGNLWAVRFLVEHDLVDVNERCPGYKKPPLSIAAYYGHTRIAIYLFQMGAKP